MNAQEVEIRVSDAQFALDQLEKLASDKGSPFYQRIDVKNCGIFGQSLGGATAIRTCQKDSRMKAGVNLDGSLLGYEPLKNGDKPCMFMLSGDNVNMFNRPWTQSDWNLFGISSANEEAMVKANYLQAFEQIAKTKGHDVYIFSLKNAGHTDFTDLAFIKNATFLARQLFRFKIIGGDFAPGSINGLRATEIVNAYLVSFFNKYLKGQPSELLDGAGTKCTEHLISRR